MSGDSGGERDVRSTGNATAGDAGCGGRPPPLRLCVPAGEGRVARPRPPAGEIGYREIGPLLLDLKAYAQKRGMRFVWYSPVPYCLFNPAAHGLGAQRHPDSDLRHLA